MKKKYFWIIYFLFDYLTAILSWVLFNYFRKAYIEKYEFEINYKLIISSLIIASLWIVLYTLFGNYKNIYKKYRLKEIYQTVSQAFSGIILIFFFLLLDDEINSYQDYYKLFIALLTLHTSITFLPRIILTSNIVSKIHNKK
jgi:FlaA1/EpsC-like NDP-sugar epimerase